ncbi:2-keto-3-deoxy-galactonokinase (plasmid) [Roseivivax sp. THAF40]|uniref:2-dehydro-3-deoxygalactonokinase n=1 Tax=unclassified Roseivivax TaxID=2639302 RepID=UPI0012691DDB|nr:MULTISPECIES: 2-dehydro-3-deoxygalactonokinase [unclassified Roseivivax]QFS84892.1 2-keto-3-deoxy-galactonokinase [Roseivivax sp. THAF197b]QFT48794.1 2-keto-3-deoxy-galactonokinase [Roseivivax sp. THAF40]
MTHVKWIGLDWGTTNLRAFAIDTDGQVAAELSSGNGMGRLAPNEFEPALLDLIEPWLTARGRDGMDPVPIFACGMVGARQGWCEVPYREVPCPAVSADGATRIPTNDKRIAMHILPGLCRRAPADVMRGEETQAAGFLLENPDYTGAICLPGTHSKWIAVENGKLSTFTTYMTGELFDLLSRHSILRHSVKSDGWDEGAFERAVEEAITNPQRAVESLFGLRAGSVLDHEPPETCRARLSGLLIGQELGLASRYWSDKPVALIGSPSVVPHYAQALASRDVVVETVDTRSATLAGLAVAAAKAGAAHHG